MDDEDRSYVLMAAARAPLLAARLTLSYLQMKRSAKAARKRFYDELVNNGLPKNEAMILADEYASSLSIRSIMRIAQGASFFGQR